jgi:hypothetical protein
LYLRDDADASDAHDAATDEALIVALDEVYEHRPELYFAYSTLRPS